MNMRPLVLALAAGCVLPVGAGAQERCTLVSSSTLTGSNMGTPQQVAVITNGHMRCGSKNIYAPQMGTNDITGVFTLAGGVRFTDADKTVTAQNAQYYKNRNLLQASGDVVVSDTKTGSTLSAPFLDYYPATGNQPARMVTSGGRGLVEMKPTVREAGTRGEPTVVQADVVEIVGERFYGRGNSTITRPGMRGFGNWVEYDRASGNMMLAHQARVESERYTLAADTIRASMADGEELREVRAINSANLTAEEIRVTSPFLVIHLDSGEVSRLIATRPATRAGGAPVSVPQILSASFNLSADSIDARAPGQQLQSVDAVGNAYAERIDTLPPPPQAAELPRWLTHDWVRGDVLNAVFGMDSTASAAGAAAGRAGAAAAAGTPAAGAARKPERVLEQLVVSGEPASATLRMQMDKPDRPWEFHHTTASKITVGFVKGAVAKLNFEGNVQGLYLSPPGVIARDGQGGN